jgi:hypothetical protein
LHHDVGSYHSANSECDTTDVGRIASSVVGIQDLNIRGMLKNSKLSRAIDVCVQQDVLRLQAVSTPI